MSIKTSFSIKDLENLSGIKAHTIRIWEKRYNLLEPERSDTNIRTYDQENLQKLLNIVLLNRHGYKVSKIANLSEPDIYNEVRKLMVKHDDSEHAINTFKLAMLNFDRKLFNDAYDRLLYDNSFKDVFGKVFIKLLEDIGFLWMTNTITPAHEHFISTLIKQKLLINIEKLGTAVEKEMTYLLFLPHNEIHELGLLYIHFELLLKGYRSVYLGPSVPIDDLAQFQVLFNKITYVSYFTVEPPVEKSEVYVRELYDKVLKPNNDKIHILGRNSIHLKEKKLPDNVIVHERISTLVDTF